MDKYSKQGGVYTTNLLYACHNRAKAFMKLQLNFSKKIGFLSVMELALALLKIEILLLLPSALRQNLFVKVEIF